MCTVVAVVAAMVEAGPIVVAASLALMVVDLDTVAVASWVDLAVVAWIVFFYFQTNIRHKHPLQGVFVYASVSAFDTLWFGRSCTVHLFLLPGPFRQRHFVH